MRDAVAGCSLCSEFGDVSRRNLSTWVADLQVSTAIVGKNQLCRGTAILVYNKAHAVELVELDPHDQVAYMEDLTRLAGALYEAYHPDKLNYALLGNVEPHLHWHVIPRREADPIDIRRPVWGQGYTEVTLSDEEYGEIAGEIRSHLEV
jgi:diadenosine tetraphosphate (Ap4A) HIT family hydrolase